MKNIYLLLLLLVGSMTSAQVVNIPDPEFKNFLLGNPSINTNLDTEIQVSEAEATDVLSIWGPTGITSLMGIKAFTNLQSLSCTGQAITSIDLSGMAHLNFVNCSENQLQTINVSGMPALVELYVSNNNLTSLDLSGLTTLSAVFCSTNQLTSLTVSDLPNLGNINCQYNPLQTLTLSGLNALTNLSCDNCQLTSLDTSNLPNLQVLYCGVNLFTFLDVSNNHNLCLFDCANNPNLMWINMKNGPKMCGEGDALSENPNLEYVCTDEDEVLFLINYFAENFMNVNVNTYCTFEPGGNYNTISGNIKFDVDNNGCDNDDLIFNNVKVNLTKGTETYSTFTNNGGYKFYTLSGEYTVSAAVENPAYFVINPTNSIFNFPTSNNTTMTQNFCVIPNGAHQDLEIVIAPITPARPGFEAIYKIVYRNKGNTVMSLDYGVTFFYNNNLMSFVSADVTPSTIGPGGLSWNYSNLKPFESRSILVTMQINPPTDLVNPVNIGDILAFNSTISPIGPDEMQIDNYGIFNQTVVGSYDPNDIQCIEGGIVDPAQIGKYLHYVIRFENTGTAEAENIVVKTEINPADFDVNSLQLLNASHSTFARVKNNVVEFIFKDIMLDSGGHGNILLKIKSKSELTVGDAVSKKADIFFDYNFPVLTNEAETVFQNLSIGDVKDVSFSLYPNPVSNVLYVKASLSIKSIQFYDVQGRILMTSQVGRNETELNISNFPDGMYFVKIITERGTATQKVIKK